MTTKVLLTHHLRPTSSRMCWTSPPLWCSCRKGFPNTETLQAVEQAGEPLVGQLPDGCCTVD